jgi:hypothetical protein
MPTLLRVGPYRFFVYATDRAGAPFVHVEQGGQVATFGLEPPRLQRNAGFHRRDVHRLERIVDDHAAALAGGWHAYFDE